MGWWYELRGENDRLVEMRRGFASQTQSAEAAERAKQMIEYVIYPRTPENLTIRTGADERESKEFDRGGCEARDLHAILDNSNLKGRFTLEFDQRTARWEIGFINLSESEFKSIFPIAFRAGSIKYDIGDSDDSKKAIRVSHLMDTDARDFTRAVAARFQDQK